MKPGTAGEEIAVGAEDFRSVGPRRIPPLRRREQMVSTSSQIRGRPLH
jgi:hypothetical protein